MARVLWFSLVCAALAAPATSQGLFVYPVQGQSPEQQQQDELQCQSWSTQRTGFNPMNAPSQGGSVAGSAAGTGLAGAALGAAVAGVTGNSASKGALGGAVAGGMIGGMSRSGRNRNTQQNEQAHRNEFMRAYTACLEGRGYSVR